MKVRSFVTLADGTIERRKGSYAGAVVLTRRDGSSIVYAWRGKRAAAEKLAAGLNTITAPGYVHEGHTFSVATPQLEQI